MIKERLQAINLDVYKGSAPMEYRNIILLTASLLNNTKMEFNFGLSDEEKGLMMRITYHIDTAEINSYVMDEVLSMNEALVLDTKQAKNGYKAIFGFVREENINEKIFKHLMMKLLKIK